MVLGLLGGDGGITNVILQIGGLMLFFLLLPRLMLFQIVQKIKVAMQDLQGNANDAEDMFLHTITDSPSQEMRDSLEPMKNMVVSPPADLDPSGMFDKLEHVLDSSEEKMDRYVDSLAPEADEEKKANLQMAFKGVYGTQQIYVLMRHFKNLVSDTKNYQIGGMVKMMLPLYKELSDSQKKATEAFVNGVPIGDSIGPLVAARLIESDEPEEIADDIIMAEEELDGKEYVVVKSKGPGARLGKYGDAIEEITRIIERKDIDKIITVDAGMRFEGEETGTVVEGTGVMMGGPGVEKGKIETVATENDIPLEGYIIKQSGPEASTPMHRKIWDAQDRALSRIRDEIRNSDGKELIIGVGNTCGVGNTTASIDGIEHKLKPYWAEQEEDKTSYFGLMKAFPMGNNHASHLKNMNTFDLFQSLVR